MKQLLSFQERRIVNILYALTIDYDYMTLKQIQDMNECSDRTVQSDIIRIQDFWEGRIKLLHFEHVVYLENRSLGKLQQYIYEILEQSLPCNLLLSIFFNPEENMEHHALETHISTSHAQRTLIDIDTFLKRHSLMISKNNGKHFIEGNSEMNLRYFMNEFLIQYQTISKSFLSKKLMDGLIKILDEAFKFHKINLTELHLNHLNLAFYLSILREKQGFKIINDDDEFHEFDFIIEDDLEFTHQEIRNGLTLFNDLVFIYRNNRHLEEKIYKNSNKLMQGNGFGHLVEDLKIITEPIYLFMIMTYCNPTKLERLLDRSILFGQESRKVRKKFFDLVIKEINTYEDNLKNFLINHINSLIFWVSLELPNYQIPIPQKILIISDLGENHAIDLKHYLETLFSYHRFETGSTLNGLSESLKSEINRFNLIISTTLLNFDPGVRMVEIDDFISERDLARIFTALR